MILKGSCPSQCAIFYGLSLLVSHPQFHAATNLLTEPQFIVGLVAVGSLLMNAPLRMFSFKCNPIRWTAFCIHYFW